MLHNDYWLVDKDAIELGGIEHAEMALKAMLNLPADASIQRDQLFDGLTLAQAKEAKANGAAVSAVAWLHQHRDPRTYAIQYYGWVRVAKNNFNVWEFNDETLEMLQKNEFWKLNSVSEHEMIDILEVSSGERFSLSAKKLLNRNASADALKRFATSTGLYRNPPRARKVAR